MNRLVQERDEVLNRLHRWLRAEFSARGTFIFEEGSAAIVGLPKHPASPLLSLTNGADGVLVQLGLGLTLTIPIDDPFDFNDIAGPVRALLENGLVVSVSHNASGSPLLRYTLNYDGGMLSTKVPGREYIDIPVPGWLVVH
ncbi:hypothetical protein [Nocardia wallacei]|uniref:hypothetical protein n=1 Tax=Nocardia wallacei TaxID=480035 RepID=UPI0024557B95|nr:hypothetical protein [Nocardia wallacei]